MALNTIATGGIANNAVTTAKIGFYNIPFRNRIINGDISVSQRGTSFSNVASGDYTIDRWKMNYRAIGNADISQVDNKTYKSLKVLNSNGSTQEIVMGTRIEDITQFNNDSFILSFYAKASTSCTLDTRVFENYGSGGSTTVTRVASGSQNKTITTSRQRFTITFTASDMSSKTIGTSNFLEINFSVSLASGANWEYDSVQLEQGTTASDFEFIPFDVNLQRCFRYYELIASGNAQALGFGGTYNANSPAYVIQYYPKRAVPSLDEVNSSNYYRFYSSGVEYKYNVSSEFLFATITQAMIVNGNAGTIADDKVGFFDTVNAGAYIALDAEL